MQQHPEYPVYDDEISLVDLATTFVRRRNIFYAVFGGVVLLALIYAFLLMPAVREYSTLVQLAEEGNKTLESPASVIATLQSRWYPELLETHLVKEGEKLPFTIAGSNPEHTNLIKLTTEADPARSEMVQSVHQQLVTQVLLRQDQSVERRKQELEQRLDSINSYLDELSGVEAAGEAAAAAVQNRIDLVARLKSLQPAETLVVARQSLEPKGTSKALVLALAIVLGGLLGIFAAFMAEFISHVRKAVIENP